MKILITGAQGQLGSEFCKILKQGYCELGELNCKFKGCEIFGLSSTDLDVGSLKIVQKTFNKIKPNFVINCAAFTDVDACETQISKAFRVNAIGARNVAVACNEINAKMVQISTDYVFDGNTQTPYVEFSSINPQNVYGKTKALAEAYVQSFCKQWFIVRTSWLYGLNGKNFVKTIVKLAQNNKKLKVVSDQFGSPTNVVDLVFAVCGLLLTNEFGIYHGSGSGFCCWNEFAKEIVSNFKINSTIEPCLTKEFKRTAKRPMFSMMQNLMFELTIGYVFRHWKIALKMFCENTDLNELN